MHLCGDQPGARRGLVGVAQRDAFEREQVVGARVDAHRRFRDRADRAARQGVAVGGRGELGLSPFRMLLNDARFAGLPMTIETPKPTRNADKINLAVLRALAGRKRITARARSLAASPI